MRNADGVGARARDLGFGENSERARDASREDDGHLLPTLDGVFSFEFHLIHESLEDIVVPLQSPELASVFFDASALDELRVDDLLSE